METEKYTFMALLTEIIRHTPEEKVRAQVGMAYFDLRDRGESDEAYLSSVTQAKVLVRRYSHLCQT